MLPRRFVSAIVFVTTSLLVSFDTVQAAGAGCAYGAYRSPDGMLAAVTRPLPGETVPRFALLNGQRGKIDASGSPLRCDGDHFEGGAASGVPFVWKRLAFHTTETSFVSEGVTLHGELLEPTWLAKPPLIVFVHGSERTSDIGIYYQWLLSAQGISTFFYDKRGTGASGGTYTQDFMLLAKDAANAARTVRKLAAGRFSRLGYFGGSQGGWVAPLAALESRADFLEVGFGFIGTPVEQDQWQVDYQLAQDGFGSEILPDVHRVTGVTGSVVASDFANVAELDAIEKQYASKPWFSKIDGQYSGDLLKGNMAKVKSDSETLRIPWQYSGLSTLERLDIPQLWVFAQDDSVAPSAKGIQRLESLSEGSTNRSIVVFPNTDHGITTFRQDANGKRQHDGSLAAGYLRLLGEFAKGSISGTFGDARWIKRAQ